MYNILFSDDYTISLRDALKYITKELKNPTAAFILKSKVDIAIKGLKTFPRIGTHLITVNKYVKEYYKVKVGNYYIIYYIDGMNVIVARFVYSKMDLNKLSL